MNCEYSIDDMLLWLQRYFKSKGYDTIDYDDRFLPARVPLYCKKEDDDGHIYDEIVIDVTTDSSIKKEDFFPSLPIKSVIIPDASPVRFYKYYVPKAKVYYAIPDYYENNSDFINFKNCCANHGIGLLIASENEVKEEIEPKSLLNDICTDIISNGVSNPLIENIISKHLENYIHQLVYYPEPNYKRRAITRRHKDDIRINMMLLKKLQYISNIKYKDSLCELTSNYLMKETRDDFEIASYYVEILWKKYLKIEYPNPDIQINFEEIFVKEFGYREHFLHQFQVFLLGAYIIDKLYDARKDSFNEFEKLYGVPIENVWLAASTYHDFNYSTQKYGSWLIEYLTGVLRFENKRVKRELSKINLDLAIIRENYLSTCEIVILNLINKYKDISEDEKNKLCQFLYENIAQKRNHALISGITLLKIYNESRKKDKIKKGGIEQAALSILLHDEKVWEYFSGCKGFLIEENECGKKCKNKNKCDPWDKELALCNILDCIDFDREPLLYLLILCDTVQDEGRVAQESSGINTYIQDVEIESDGNVNITINTLSKSSHRIKRSEINRIAEFLDDGKFRIIMKPHKNTYGKEHTYKL